jgi:hypothetical protein
VFIVDVGSEVFVWVGKKASEVRHSAVGFDLHFSSFAKNEKKNAMASAQKYLQEKKRPK